MPMFNTSRFRKAENIGGEDATKPDVFSRKGRLYKTPMEKRIGKIPLSKTQKEYVKEVMAKYDRPESKGVTREEFLHGLDEMAKDKTNPIKQRDIEKIKRRFK